MADDPYIRAGARPVASSPEIRGGSYETQQQSVAADVEKKRADISRTQTLTPIEASLRGEQATKLHRENVAAANAESERQKAAQRQAIAFRDNAEVALNAINRLRTILGPTSAGYGAMLKDLPESRAKEAAALIQQLQSNKFFTQIAELKAESGKGQTGIGRVLQSEIPLFLSRWGNLDQARGTHGLGESLNVMENQIRRMYARMNGADIDNPDPKAAYEARQQYGIKEPGEVLAQPVAPTLVREGATLAPLGGTDETKSVATPAPMQREFEEWVTKHLGNLDPQEYARFRLELDKKYGYPADEKRASELYAPEAERLNTAAKRGATINLQIPPVNAAVTAQDRAAAEAREGAVTGRALSAAAGLTSGATADLFPTVVSKLTGKPEEEVRRTQAAYEGTYPGAATAGRIAGGVAQAALAPELFAKYGVPLMGAEGAISGAATNPDDRLAGAIRGGATSLVLGAGLTGAGKLASGLGEAVSPLAQKYKIPVTVGTLTQSPAARWLESKLAGIPVVGAGVRNRMDESLIGMNTAAFDDALKNIGGAPKPYLGQKGVDQSLRQVGTAYDAALRGVRVPMTPELRDALDTAITGAGSLDPKYTLALQKDLGNLLSKKTLSGKDVQLILSRSRGVSAAARKADGGAWSEYVLPHISDIENTLTKAVEGVKPGSAEAMRAASDAYRKTMILADSVNDHLNTGGVFTPDTLLKHVENNVQAYEGAPTLARGNVPGRKELPLLDLAMAAADKKTGLAFPAIGNGVALPAALGAAGLTEAGIESALSPIDKDTGAHTTDFGTAAVRNLAALGAVGAAPRVAYTDALQNALQRALTRQAGPGVSRLANVLPVGLATAFAPGREYNPPSMEMPSNMAIPQFPRVQSNPAAFSVLAQPYAEATEAPSGETPFSMYDPTEGGGNF